MIKYSRQRECIRDFLACCRNHPTAETVYMNVRESFPNISLGTVYRNLSLLAELGEIQKISTGIGPDRSISWLKILLTGRLRGISPIFLANANPAWKKCQPHGLPADSQEPGRRPSPASSSLKKINRNIKIALDTYSQM